MNAEDLDSKQILSGKLGSESFVYAVDTKNYKKKYISFYNNPTHILCLIFLFYFFDEFYYDKNFLKDDN